MKYISRRDFIHAGCFVAAVTLVADPAEAWVHGAAILAANNNRVTINAQIAYLNIAKGFAFSVQDPTTVSSDGYPLTAPATAIVANPSMPDAYYGTFTWSFTGQGSMQIGAAPPMVLTSGGSFLVGTPTTDVAPGNTTILSQTNPVIVFAFGWNIQSISNNGSGLIRINTLTNFVASGAGYTIKSGIDRNGNVGQVVNITGAPTNTGANGLWAVTNLTASSFDLVGSTFTNSSSVAGQAVFAASNLSVKLYNGGTYSGMGNLIWCRTADLSQVNAGLLVDNTMIAQLTALFNHTGATNSTRGWLRFMDLIGVQGSFECDFSQRIPATNIGYSVANYRSGYWTPSTGGAITNGGSDNYTCADPSVSVLNGAVYLDNAIVQGIPSATNSGTTPTLAVGSGPAKPIFRYGSGAGIAPIQYKCIVAPTTPGTDQLVFTFSATWLNGGSPLVLTYPTVAGDSSTATLNANLTSFFNTNATLLSAKVFAGNSGTPTISPPTAQLGALTMSYTSGTATIVVGNLYANSITAGATASSGGTFIYNYLLDGWFYFAGGMTCSVPIEVIVEMCNRVGAHCWYTWGITKGSYVTSVVQFLADATTGLTSGLRFGGEAFNEVWNSHGFPYPVLTALGSALGWSGSSFVSQFSYTSLKTIQYGALAKAAWTGKGRSASDYYNLQMTQGTGIFVNANFDTSSLQGVSLNTSNATYANYGGLNGGAAPSYNVAPNRPVDITNAIGYAPYWNSHWLGNSSFSDATQLAGTVAQNSDLLQAALNFANGLVSTAFTSLVNEFNGTTVKSGGSTGGIDFAAEQTLFTQMEALCAHYDGAGRTTAGLPPLGVMHYEGGPSFGSGSNGNTGVNSLTFNTVATADITALANRFTALSWTTTQLIPYTFSGTGSLTEMATMILQMLQAWKFDVDNNGNPANTGSYKGLIKTSYYQALATTSGANRETKPAQYGYANQNWGMFPFSIFNSNPYKNYDAIREWNAGA